MIPALRADCEYPAEGIAYLDHAATGPLAGAARRAMEVHLDERARTAPNNFETLLPRLEAGRETLAALLGTETENVEYVPNTSYGINLVSQGLDWREGDRVAVPACEFPANVLPWLALERRGVAVDRIPAPRGRFMPEAVREIFTPRTRVLSVSWVQFLSGFRAPLAALAEICHERGVLLCVDAIQGMGALRMEMDALGLDLVASGGHKWMLGPQGAGFVGVSPRLRDRLAPTYGWLNGPVDWDDFGATDLSLHPDATRFRVGTFASAPILGLVASAQAFLDAGPAEVERHVLRAAARVARGLHAFGFERWGATHDPDSGIVTVEHAAPEAVFDALRRENVWISVRDRKLRFAPHATTSDEDIDRALDAFARHEARTAPAAL